MAVKIAIHCIYGCVNNYIVTFCKILLISVQHLCASFYFITCAVSSRCTSHFLVALVFRFDKVYVKNIGGAPYVILFSFGIYFLCSHIMLQRLRYPDKGETLKENNNTFYHCFIYQGYLCLFYSYPFHKYT